MKYPLWQRIAIQNGQVLYADIVQKRYQISLHKKYKNRFSISDNIKDILFVPAEYQLGNYFCDLYYDDKSYHCVFTQYDIPERKKVLMIREPLCPYRMDYIAVREFQKQFNGYDDLILCSKYFAHNGLQSNLLFCEYGGWFSYEKPDFITAELERLVTEKKVRLLDASGFSEADKMMFINEFEPFDLSRALPINNEVITNYDDKFGFSVSKKIVLLSILFLLFVLSPLFITFEKTTYPFTSGIALSFLFNSVGGMLALIVSFFLVIKLKLIEFSIIGKLLVCLMKFLISIILAAVFYILFYQVLLPVSGMYYTLLFQEKQQYEFTVEHIDKMTRGVKPAHQLASTCLYSIQLKNEINRRYYALCTNNIKNINIGDRYRMDLQESDFGYRLSNIVKQSN